MWVLVGLLVLIGSSVAIGMRLQNLPWKSEEGPYCLVRLVTNPKSGKLLRIEAGVRTASVLDFEIKPERFFDRVAKRLGLSVEAQIGKPDFDRAAYLVSEDRRVVAALKSEPVLLEHFRSLVENRRSAGFRCLRVTCRNGLLRADFKVLGDGSGQVRLLEATGRLLKEAAALLPPRTFSDERGVDPFRLRAIVVLASAGGMAVNGVVQLARMSFISFPETLDVWPLWVRALLIGALMLTLLVVATIALLGRTSRAHIVLMQVLLLGAFGAPIMAFTELRDLNIEADDQPSQWLPATVTSKESHYRRKRGMVYKLYVSDWTGAGDRRSFEVAGSLYDAIPVGEDLLVHQHPGYLGARWVEGFRRVERRGY